MYEVVITGLDQLDGLAEIPEKINRKAVLALNAAVRRARTQGAREILAKINFPKGYLSPQDERLTVAKFATVNDKEAIVRGRQRATSLATFATKTPQPGKRGGVTVSIKPGSAKLLKQVFAIRLRAGSADLDTKSNLGLAIRLRPGEKLSNKTKMVKFSSGSKSSVYLLYGPSVDQVFRTVSAEMIPDVEAHLEDEFLRLLGLDL